MKKGTKVIYDNTIYEVWQKKGPAVTIYNPATPIPELTMMTVSINKVKKA